LLSTDLSRSGDLQFYSTTLLNMSGGNPVCN